MCLKKLKVTEVLTVLAGIIMLNCSGTKLCYPFLTQSKVCYIILQMLKTWCYVKVKAAISKNLKP